MISLLDVMCGNRIKLINVKLFKKTNLIRIDIKWTVCSNMHGCLIPFANAFLKPWYQFLILNKNNVQCLGALQHTILKRISRTLTSRCPVSPEEDLSSGPFSSIFNQRIETRLSSFHLTGQYYSWPIIYIYHYSQKQILKKNKRF